MIAFANAKINLGLFLTEKRKDGYHNLQTIFYPIRINDAIEIIDSEINEIELYGLYIPGNKEDNLCLKVLRYMQELYNFPSQKIILYKKIPVGAGLGGGSADAAFLLKLINNKFELQLTITQLQDYARQFGSDCAFFIDNKPCFADGKGDEFEAIPPIDLSAYHTVLVKSPVHVSTKDAYAGACVKPPPFSLKEIVNLPLKDWKNNIFNDFESSVFQKYPAIEKIKNDLYQAGAVFSLMSGSGSAVYGIFEKKPNLVNIETDNVVFYNV